MYPGSIDTISQECQIKFTNAGKFIQRKFLFGLSVIAHGQCKFQYNYVFCNSMCLNLIYLIIF